MRPLSLLSSLDPPTSLELNTDTRSSPPHRCLFTALALVLCPGQPPHATAQVLRQTVADAIEADAESWSDAILGHPRASYVSTILQASSWGGAIELLILAKHFGTEVCSVDVQSGRVDRFGEGEGRVWIVYSGIRALGRFRSLVSGSSVALLGLSANLARHPPPHPRLPRRL